MFWGGFLCFFVLLCRTMSEEDELVYEVHEIVVQRVGHVPVAKGDFNHLPKKVKTFVAHCVSNHDVLVCFWFVFFFQIGLHNHWIISQDSAWILHLCLICGIHQLHLMRSYIVASFWDYHKVCIWSWIKCMRKNKDKGKVKPLFPCH